MSDPIQSNRAGIWRRSVVVSAALVLAVFSLPMMTADANEPSEPVTGGSITWGVKESFRSYIVSNIAHGSVTVAGGATDNGSVTTFVNATGDWSDSAGEARTAGSVRFVGHKNELDVTISNPRLVNKASGAQLVVDVLDSTGASKTDVVFATVNLAGRVTKTATTVKVNAAPATLTKAGEAAFIYDGFPMYTAGEQLDPISATFDVASTPEPTEPTTGPTTAPTAEPTVEPTTAPTTAATTQPTVSPSPKPKPNTSPKAKSGELVWGVKTSFRSYITGPIARGSVSVSAGAKATSGGYWFGQSSTSAKAPNPVGTTTYRGGVQFTGHHGELNLALSAPAVRVTSANSAMLTAHVAGKGRVNVAVVTLSAAKRTTAAGWVQYASAPAALTPAGSTLFARDGSEFYPPGTPMDPVTFSIGSSASKSSRATAAGTSVVSAASTASNWTAPTSPPATTGLLVKQDEVNAGDEIAVSGEGFAPNETGIRVVLHSTPTILAQDVTADGAGKATWQGVIPATVEPGKHTLTFQGSVSRGVVLEIGAAEKIVGCELTDGRLDWGFKESFRAYVSGSIANGDWSTSGNASYKTPEFTWSKGVGVQAEDGDSGELKFTGEVKFTGHSGALDTSISNPVVTFVDNETAALAVDYSGGTMDAAMAGKDDRTTTAGVQFADLDLAAGKMTTDGQVVTITDIPTTLTAAGNAVFPNYAAGAALDPVTLTFTVATDCAATNLASTQTDEQVVVTPTSGGGNGPSWLPWVGGMVLGAAASALITVMIMRRRIPGAPA